MINKDNKLVLDLHLLNSISQVKLREEPPPLESERGVFQAGYFYTY